MAKPIFKWPGGKRRLAKHLLPLFPEHACYVELFCGAGALFFLRPEPAQTEVLNDWNSDLVTLFRVVQNHLAEFLNQFRLAISSRQIFDWHKATRSETLTDIQRAARFYYIQSHAFGGRVENPTFGTSTTRPAINLHKIEDTLVAASERLGGVFIEQGSWQQCVTRYDRQHTFFYADPPYFELAGYGVAFPLSEYEQLAEAMRTIKGKMMVSINDHPAMRTVFAGFRMVELETTYTIGSNRSEPRRELAIMNW